MKISVTQEHIDKGVPAKTDCCALTLAFRDSGFPKAIVGIVLAYPMNNDDGVLSCILLPREAIDFRNSFDTGKPVKPFTFEVEVPA